MLKVTVSELKCLIKKNKELLESFLDAGGKFIVFHRGFRKGEDKDRGGVIVDSLDEVILLLEEGENYGGCKRERVKEIEEEIKEMEEKLKEMFKYFSPKTDLKKGQIYKLLTKKYVNPFNSDDFKGYEKLERYGAHVEYLKGYKLFLQGRKEAEKYLLHAVELNPDHLRAQLALAEFYYRIGKNNEAFDRVQEVLRLDNKNERAHELKYYIFKRWGYDEEAVNELKRGLDEDTTSVQLRVLYGLELLESRDRRKKRKSYAQFKRVIELDPENKEAADGLQRLGLRPSRIRALGYRGIFLSIDHFDIKDSVFIPRRRGQRAKRERKNP